MKMATDINQFWETLNIQKKARETEQAKIDNNALFNLLLKPLLQIELVKSKFNFSWAWRLYLSFLFKNLYVIYEV